MSRGDVVHIVHVVQCFDVGGLENGVVNLINRIPADEFKHTIVSLTTASDFAARVERPVEIVCLGKKEGKDIGIYRKIHRVLKRLDPDIVHTRNLSTLEAQIPAWLSGVKGRIHGEHGRDMHDLDNTSSKYRLLRRGISPLVQRYIAVSGELAAYLSDSVGIGAHKITRICNGVDTCKFGDHVSGSRDDFFATAPFDHRGRTIMGTVGRMKTVKDQPTLVRAYLDLLDGHPQLVDSTALMLIGDGPLMVSIEDMVRGTAAAGLVWMTGTRDDIPAAMRAMDVFVLPSLAEGISNTILEAMASALPVVATDVGGNSELVAAEVNGVLVPRSSPAQLADALLRYCHDPALRQDHAQASRARALEHFSLNGMVERYIKLYRDISGLELSSRRTG